MESLEDVWSAAQEGMGYLYSAASLEDMPLTDYSGQRLCLVGLSCILLAYFIYYLGWVAGKPKVVGSGQLKEKILKSCPILSECYWPTIWGFQCHVSTVMRFLLQKPPEIQYRREFFTLSDRGEVALDWGMGSRAVPTPDMSQDDRPVLLILPGITGCSVDNYVQHLVEDGLLEGYRPVVFNQRGNGGVMLKTIRTYSASDISDLFEVVQHIYSCYPGVSIVGVGVSLGGMLLTQYLHQLGQECDISGVISISASWDPFVSRKSLEDVKINKVLYSRVMVNNLKAIVKKNIDSMTPEERESYPYDLHKIMKAKVVSEIDVCLTAPLFGFSCWQDYYESSKNSDKIHKIRKPLVCVMAADDPFVPEESLPFEEIERNPHTVMVVTSRGGHFGFIEGLYPSNKTWMDRTVRQLLSAFKQQ